MIKYDVYKRLNGMLYRVPLGSSLHAQAEVLVRPLNIWVESFYTVGDILASPWVCLKAHNVVFKARLCSQ